MGTTPVSPVVTYVMDLESEARLKQILPILAKKVRAVASQLKTQGIEVRVVQALRSWSMQQELWQQGRDSMGNVIDKRQVVTNAPPGHSWHEFGMAVDMCPFVNDKPVWELSDPAWDKLKQVGILNGLVSGACFHDPDHPHLQLTGTFGLSPDDEVRYIFREAGMEGIWKAANLV